MNTFDGGIEMLSLGLLLARLAIGLLMAAHGAQKLFGWFGGYGLNATGQFMVGLGYPMGRTFAAAASIGEIASGLLIAAGLFGPIGPAMMLGIMIVAAITVHWAHGVFAMSNGIELPLLYGAAGIILAVTGYGRYSLDALFGIGDRWPAGVTALVLAGGIVGGILNLVVRRPPKAPVAGSST